MSNATRPSCVNMKIIGLALKKNHRRRLEHREAQELSAATFVDPDRRSPAEAQASFAPSCTLLLCLQ